MLKFESIYNFSGPLAAEILSSAEEFNLCMGEFLISHQVFPDSLYFLVSGRLRHIVQDPIDNNNIFTLLLCRSVYCRFGLLPVWFPCETLSAAEDSVLLKLLKHLLIQFFINIQRIMAKVSFVFLPIMAHHF